jgi:hypothetical protein
MFWVVDVFDRVYELFQWINAVFGTGTKETIEHGDVGGGTDRNISLKLFELLIGKHFFNQSEDGLFVFVVQLLDKPHLLHRGFAFDGTVWSLAVT